METLSLGAWAGSRFHCFDPLLARRSVLCFRAKLLRSCEDFQGTPHIASSACHARPLEACGASFRVDSIAMESLDLESAGAHARSLFDVGQGHFMGGDFEPWRLGAWAAAHETIPKSCFGISVQIHKDAASGSGLERGGAHARSFLMLEKGI